MLKTVIYARYSSEKQNEQSIEGQVHECESFAHSHDMVIVKHYIDRALSGKTNDRPQFLKMIKDSAAGSFDAVLVYKTDRFARNRYDSAVYKAKLKRNGIKIFYAKENIPDGPEGIILESMLEGFAEYYSAELSQKVKRGIKENVRKGLSFGGGCPFGYKIIDKKYTLDETQAYYVKKIFQDYADGRRTVDIFNELNTAPNCAGKGKKWNRSSLHRMLANKKYIGIYEFDDLIVKDAIPAIIDETLFNRVQKRIQLNKRRTSKYSVNYLLSGKLFCGICGKSMTGTHGTSKSGIKYYYYACSNAKCKQHNYKKEFLEELVIKYVVKSVLNPKNFKEIARRCVAIAQCEKDTDTTLLNLNQQLIVVDKKLHNIMAAIEEGIITSTTKERLEQLERDKYSLEVEIQNRQQDANLTITEDQIIYMLNYFYEHHVDKDFYNRIIDGFINKIYIYDGKMVVVYNLTDSSGNLKKSEVDEIVKCSRVETVGSPFVNPRRY